MTNEIGDLGEAIFEVEILRDYFFRARHLGEKWPASDFYIELIGPTDRFFFIVEVKSTTQGFDKKGNLNIVATKERVRALNAYYCPTYLAGVEMHSNSVYLTAVNRDKRKDMGSLPAKFILNSENRLRLFKEVQSFWKGTDVKKYKRNFKHVL